MKTSTNINVLLFIVYMCIIAHQTHSFSIGNPHLNDRILAESDMNDEYESTDNLYPPQLHPFLGKRRLDSAEKYFDWADKTNRPMEYLRGKRFWLFTKKDEQNNNPDSIHDAQTSPNAVKQGIWRSGIVGRRRR